MTDTPMPDHARAATHPAPITTREQLAALPSGSVVRTDDGLVYERQLGWTWRGQPAQVPLPARVLDVGYPDDAPAATHPAETECPTPHHHPLTRCPTCHGPRAATHPAETRDPDLYEQLAAIEHERWAHWQRYLHSQCTVQIITDRDPGALAIPSGYVEHLWRLIDTPYAELTEAEKASDREQVDRYWRLIQPAAAPGQGRERELAAWLDEQIAAADRCADRAVGVGNLRQRDRARVRLDALREVRDRLRAHGGDQEGQR